MANYNYGDEPASGNFGNGQSTEKSIKSCYAVVYELDNRKWVVAGEGGWSEVHLCEDSLDNSHRILAWTVKSQQVLMNCNVTAECAYKEKSKNFHSFSDENGNRYGLGFHKSESGLKQATHFLKSVKSVIEQCKVDLNPSPPEAPAQSYQQSQSQQPKQSSKTPQNPTPMGQSYQNNNNNDYNEQSSQNANQPGMVEPKLFSAYDGDDNNNNNNYNDNYNNNYNNQYNNNKQNGYDQYQNKQQNEQQYNEYQSSQYPKSQAQPEQPHPPPVPPNQYESQNEQIQYKQQKKQNQYQYQQQQQVQQKYQQQDQYRQQGSPSPGPISPTTAKLNGVGSNNNPTYHLNKEQHKSLPTVPLGPLGNLKILPPKPQKHLSGDKKIKEPNAVEHKMRVTHDKETGLYSGLPKEWLEHLNKQFGVNPKQLPGVQFNEYQAKIPKVLVTLRSALEEANGYQQVGIFRLAPNASDSKAVKEKIDKGQLSENEEKVDVNVYANLIKVWFRDLPDPLLNCVNPDLIEHVQNVNDAANVVTGFPEPNKSIFLWLCDMCVDIAKYEKTNKMGAQNMAIVVGPNLFNADTFENPMKAMTYSGKVVEFFKHAILWRQKTR